MLLKQMRFHSTSLRVVGIPHACCSILLRLRPRPSEWGNRTKTNYLQPLAISGVRKDGMGCGVDLWNLHNFRACMTPRQNLILEKRARKSYTRVVQMDLTLENRRKPNYKYFISKSGNKIVRFFLLIKH